MRIVSSLPLVLAGPPNIKLQVLQEGGSHPDLPW